ncbi:hypothetical protein HMPREF1139_0186 [Campylobacter sp. FOBRC14]|jgi:hypothetical protein|nr:hypothetical protein HMPREF1139_0186 [Campylobacter sp. FOBRC14]
MIKYRYFRAKELKFIKNGVKFALDCRVPFIFGQRGENDSKDEDLDRKQRRGAAVWKGQNAGA